MNHKRVYIVATVSGLSLMAVIPMLAAAQGMRSHMMWGRAGNLGRSAMMAVAPSHARAFFGVVSSVNGASFSIDQKMRNATTTFTVSTDSTTTIKKDGAADVIGDLAVGQHVVVMGALATSTKTISAKSVNIITHPPTQNSLQHVFQKSK